MAEEVVTFDDSTQPAPSAEPTDTEKAEPEKAFSWRAFLKGAKDEQVAERLSQEVQKLVYEPATQLSRYCVLSLDEPEDASTPGIQTAYSLRFKRSTLTAPRRSSCFLLAVRDGLSLHIK